VHCPGLFGFHKRIETYSPLNLRRMIAMTCAYNKVGDLIRVSSNVHTVEKR
jgi:hypothetical protein